MNVLLVRPMPDRESIGLQRFMICEPLELEYLAAFLEPHGHRVAIVDMILERQNLAHFVRLHKPDIVGFTAYITHVGVVKDYARQVKAYDSRIRTAVGGVHAEVVPGDFEDDAIDFIIHADGLASFKAILDRAGQDRETVRRETPGVWNGHGKSYPPPPSRFDFPHPDRTKTERYRLHYNYIFHDRCATLKTAIGCVYRCEFCFCIEAARHAYVERDLADVIEELKGIREHNIFIVDDNFLYDPARVTAFCDLLEKEAVRKNFILFGRTDFIARQPALIKRFKSLGLQAVFLGLESFREQDLQSMDKRLTVQDNVRALRILEENDIERHAGIIVGPDWRDEDFDGLIRWLSQFKTIFVNLQPLTPMPGTRAYERLKSRIVADRCLFPKWDMAHLVVEPENLSPRRFYFRIIRAYFATSAGFAGQFHILRKYGLKTYLRVLLGALHIVGQYIRLGLRGTVP